MVGHMPRYWEDFLTGDPERPLLLDLPARELLLLQVSTRTHHSRQWAYSTGSKTHPSWAVCLRHDLRDCRQKHTAEPDLGEGLLLGV